ncbi:N-acetylmuramoyl-L-alanine amidase [Falsihalocynthiibacter sp. BN13B15]|uniref:N-acetylmuramoyl-L-alanine amidase n=1 Tax=Falsihalocynthiibacter sp. BN13B15 TaxID=3240871 RepID=UPI00350EC49E
MQITQCPSPNFGPRRHGGPPDLILLHYTAMSSCDAALARLCSPEFEVSAHFLISEKGGILQLVAQEMRAWHAGAGSWGDCSDINSHSIGIELDNTGRTPYSEPQMAALEALLPQIMQAWNIPPERVIGHSDMAPHRKADPGRRMDWCRLALQGLSVWPETTPDTQAPDFAEWCQDAARFGYGTGQNMDVKCDAYLAAFRDRFRAGHRGPLDSEDMRIIQDLAQRFPVDGGRANA